MDDSVENATAPETNGNGNGLHSHSHAHAPKKNPPSVISNQLRDELIRILTTGDVKNDGAFTVAVAAQVEKFIAAAREILMTESLAQNDISSLMMMRRQHMGGFGGPFPLLGSSSSDYLPAPVNNENFGVQAIRQIVDGFKTTTESPAKLVEALVIARENNLTDVVASLEKKLGVAKAEVPEATEGEAS
jgi:hypothetical protein